MLHPHVSWLAWFLWFLYAHFDVGHRSNRPWAFHPRRLTEKDAAAMMGINPDRANMIAWVIGVGSLGVAAPMLTSIYTFHAYVAVFWQMMAFMLSVVLGGLGDIFLPPWLAV